jgi:hypothetical protein
MPITIQKNAPISLLGSFVESMTEVSGTLRTTVDKEIFIANRDLVRASTGLNNASDKFKKLLTDIFKEAGIQKVINFDTFKVTDGFCKAPSDFAPENGVRAAAYECISLREFTREANELRAYIDEAASPIEKKLKDYSQIKSDLTKKREELIEGAENLADRRAELAGKSNPDHRKKALSRIRSLEGRLNELHSEIPGYVENKLNLLQELTTASEASLIGIQIRHNGFIASKDAILEKCLGYTEEIKDEEDRIMSHTEKVVMTRHREDIPERYFQEINIRLLNDLSEHISSRGLSFNPKMRTAMFKALKAGTPEAINDLCPPGSQLLGGNKDDALSMDERIKMLTYKSFGHSFEDLQSELFKNRQICVKAYETKRLNGNLLNDNQRIMLLIKAFSDEMVFQKVEREWDSCPDLALNL